MELCAFKNANINIQVSCVLLVVLVVLVVFFLLTNILNEPKFLIYNKTTQIFFDIIIIFFLEFSWNFLGIFLFSFVYFLLLFCIGNQISKSIFLSYIVEFNYEKWKKFCLEKEILKWEYKKWLMITAFIVVIVIFFFIFTICWWRLAKNAPKESYTPVFIIINFSVIFCFLFWSTET